MPLDIPRPHCCWRCGRTWRADQPYYTLTLVEWKPGRSPGPGQPVAAPQRGMGLDVLLCSECKNLIGMAVEARSPEARAS